MKNFIILATGITIGATVSWMYHKNKYEQLVEEEVESIREHMKNKDDNREKREDEPVQEKTKMASEYGETSSQLIDDDFEEDAGKVDKIINYNKYSTPDKEEKLEDKYKQPYVVTPDDFASVPLFDTDTFYYYANNVIANEDHEPIDDVEGLLGMTTLEVKTHFGEFEEDSVYIRNMRLKTDYEILRELDDFIPNR